jgi:hypothetical protein
VIDETDNAPPLPTPLTPATAAPPIRASHGDRAEIVVRLQTALSEGRLELDEFEERATVAYQARCRSELLPLTADLPEAEPTGPRAEWGKVWQAIVRQAWLSSIGSGSSTVQPTTSQRRIMTVTLVAAALWTLGCLLLGFYSALD